MSKGVMGKSLTIIISLVLGIAALTILWMFLTGSTRLITVGVQKIIMDFKCGLICNKILKPFPEAMKGMCSGS